MMHQRRQVNECGVGTTGEMELPIGKHRYRYTARDKSGKESMLEYNLDVEGMKLILMKLSFMQAATRGEFINPDE